MPSSPGDGQHEIRNYAAYSLLPAIQVADPEEADVVVSPPCFHRTRGA